MEEEKKKGNNGRPPKAIKKEKLVAFRLSNDEYEEFENRVKRSHLDSKSKFIKNYIFDKQISAPEMPLITYYNSIADIAKELNKSGENINQIVRKLHRTELSEKELRLISYELNRIMEELIFSRQLTSKVTDFLAEFREKYMK